MVQVSAPDKTKKKLSLKYARKNREYLITVPKKNKRSILRLEKPFFLTENKKLQCRKTQRGPPKRLFPTENIRKNEGRTFC